jgi:pimeloyl-ACP methyl ester carboxylesterase/DNA-binding CsgD family transcriptional regulator
VEGTKGRGQAVVDVLSEIRVVEGSRVAYRSSGAGPRHVLLVPDGLLPIASLTTFGPFAEFLDQLSVHGRLLVFDRRGLGASAVKRPHGLTLADWADDARDVLDAEGARRAVVVGLAEGAMTAVALAARYPERVEALVLVNATPGPQLSAFARDGLAPRYIAALRARLPDRFASEVPGGLEVVAPSVGRDRAFGHWVQQAFSAIGDPAGLRPALDTMFASDARGFLGLVRCPTLVVHRRHDAWFGPSHGRFIANAVAGARYVELPGADHAPYLGDSAVVHDAIGWFLTSAQPGPALRDNAAALTARQREALRHAAGGCTDREIAARMGVSVRTVQKHLHDGYRHLGVHNRTAAANLVRGAPGA